MKGEFTIEEYKHVCEVFNKYQFTIFELAQKNHSKFVTNLPLGVGFWVELYKCQPDNWNQSQICTKLNDLKLKLMIITPLSVICFINSRKILIKNKQTMANLTGKTVNLNMVSMDGNAFNLLGQFQSQARREGWSKDEINKVIEEAKKGDYDHLLSVLLDHSNTDEFEPEEKEEEEEEEWVPNAGWE